jgi:hypothetical protein
VHAKVFHIITWAPYNNMGKLRLRIHKPQQDCREEKENEWICKSENKSDTTY